MSKTLPEPKMPEKPGPLFGWPRSRTIHKCKPYDGVLLVRYFLLRVSFLAIFLHHLVESDEDRALHDHPWSFLTFLFHRGYWEHTPEGRFWRPRFSLLFRPAEWAHRLELAGPTWTLVFRFRRRRVWGFYMPGGWMDWIAFGKEWCD